MRAVPEQRRKQFRTMPACAAAFDALHALRSLRGTHSTRSCALPETQRLSFQPSSPP